MSTVRLGAAFVNQTPLAWAANRGNLARALDLARAAGVSHLCLPELAVTGYGCEDLFLAPFLRERALAELGVLVGRTQGLCTAFGLPFELGGALYNTVAVCADGRLLGLVPKQRLARDGIHYEPRWFRAWEPGRVERAEVLGREVPVGDLLFACGGAVLGFEICEDAWGGPERPAPRLARRGANLIFGPAASHYAPGKQAVRLGLGVGAAADHGLAYAYANLMGNESGRAVYDGGAFLLHPDGAVAARGARFSYRDVGLVCADVEVRRAAPVEGAGLVRDPFPPALPASPPPPSLGDPAAHEAADPREDFARAGALGIFDYLRKSRARGFCLSLSGGADSAACALLVRLMAAFAVDELGFEGFAARLPDVPGIAAAGGQAAAMPVLLRTLYQATAHSSATTRSAAEGVARAVGSAHAAVEVQHLVDAYRSLAEGVLGRPLGWPEDDLTLQNLQARVRSPAVWTLANAEGRLLLATNNRSEAATGYTSMDGDTSGGLAPVAGVGKDFLRGWLRWMEERGPRELGPVPALKAVNDQAPTAELRPLEDRQTDEDDLMPYAVLDALERSAVVRRLPPEGALEALRGDFPGEPGDDLAEWTRSFYALWSGSQWKRERLAVSLHLDDHSVDPRTWCRWPVLNGGFGPGSGA